MERREFGHTRSEVPIIGQGTWYIEAGDRDKATVALRHGLDLGMTHIDTAEMYGAGQAEQIVGAAVGDRRDEVFIVSKVLPQHASLKGTIAACEKSLKRLATDRIDCYLLHWRGSYPLEDTVAAFEALKRDGKILSWGVSNFDVSDLEELSDITDPANVACNQVLYHLEQRAIEHAVLPWCEKYGVAVVGYSPFGHSGSFLRSNKKGLKMLEDVAAAHDATPRQVALRFLVRRPSLFAIPKSSSVEHIAENASAGDLQLTASEIAQIDKAFPSNPRRSSLPVL
jgi:diketogulonate reductase-like aldo/keto reductase